MIFFQNKHLNKHQNLTFVFEKAGNYNLMYQLTSSDVKHNLFAYLLPSIINDTIVERKVPIRAISRWYLRDINLVMKLLQLRMILIVDFEKVFYLVFIFKEDNRRSKFC